MELAFALLTIRGLHVAVCLHTAQAVPQHEWSDALAGYTRLRVRDARYARMLVITDGGGPDAKQRSQLKALWDGHAFTTSVIVPGMNNVVKRGLMTALTWINPQMAFFLPAQLESALHHLSLDGAQPTLWPVFASLQRKLPPLRTLTLMAEAARLAPLAADPLSSRAP